MHHFENDMQHIIDNLQETITTYTNESQDIMAVNITAVLIGQIKQ